PGVGPAAHPPPSPPRPSALYDVLCPLSGAAGRGTVSLAVPTVCPWLLPSRHLRQLPQPVAQRHVQGAEHHEHRPRAGTVRPGRPGYPPPLPCPVTAGTLTPPGRDPFIRVPRQAGPGSMAKALRQEEIHPFRRTTANHAFGPPSENWTSVNS